MVDTGFDGELLVSDDDLRGAGVAVALDRRLLDDRRLELDVPRRTVVVSRNSLA